ncbi:MAG: helix-turn-helix domain-containing protein [Clostridiales bacterium]|nr:helix-turn-helix domain-containing protein [Clostridiales bacterium]
MNLANNLRKIRKENGLSQEQLAEKLGVSRQSVSKWESEQAYPEMEKMIQICDIFDITMDELLNQNVSQVKESKEEKANLAKYIESFLAYVTKTIDMFGNMKWSQRIKCIFEQCVFGAIIAFACFIIGNLLKSILRVFFNKIPVVMDFFAAVYVAACVILGFVLLFQIFKIRYLNYYEAVKEPKQPVKEKTEPEQTENVAAEPVAPDVSESPVMETTGKKQEKIIIRDPDHSEYKFISGLVRCFLWIIKLFAWTFGIGVCCALIATVCLLVMLFMIAKSGLLFVGAFLITAATAAILSIILVAVYCFLFNRKHHRGRLAIAFLCSVIIIGAGLGVCFVGTANFNTPDINDASYQDMFVSDTIDGGEADKLIVTDYRGSGYVLEYVPVDSDEVKIEVRHPDYMRCEPCLYTSDEGYNYLFIPSEDVGLKEIRNIIKAVNRRIIPTYEYSQIKTTVYASQQNIEKIILSADSRTETNEGRTEVYVEPETTALVEAETTVHTPQM